MLERKSLGVVPPKPHTVFAVDGKNLFEYVLTRNGFAGGFSILYGANAPTVLEKIEEIAKPRSEKLLGSWVPLEDVPIARRHLRTAEAESGADYLSSRTALYRSQGCRISKVKGVLDGSNYVFCNGDADELFFVHEGSGHLLTMFGRLPVRQHDYVLIPRGVSYLWEGKGQWDLFLVEGDPSIKIPRDFLNEHGQLKLEAPYTHRDFSSPVSLLSETDSERFLKTMTLKNNRITLHRYAKSPAHMLGWDGSIYPVAFSIHDYLPKTGKVHLPPNLHLTFGSEHFVVCSFVPRMLDYLEGAIPCPYPHANVQCDEILYYVSGNFTSRKGIGPGSISFHPAGVPHGPQPGNYFASVGSKETNELAVMVDTWHPLQPSRLAMGMEDASYTFSWVE